MICNVNYLFQQKLSNPRFYKDVTSSLPLVYIYLYICTYTYTCTHNPPPTHPPTHTHTPPTHTYIYIDTHIHTHTRTHTHTHTHKHTYILRFCGAVAMSLANGLVGTGFASRYRLQPRAGF